MLKIASWNVNSLRVRLPHVLDWLAKEKPDFLGLQELKMTDEQFPLEEIEAAGYEAIFNGQKTYNGVAILSKTSASDVITALPGFDDPQKRVIGARFNDLFLLNLYVPNGSEVGSEKYAYKLEWFDALQSLTRDLVKAHKKLVLVGDFNIAPADEDVHDPEQWRDKILCSEAERAHFQNLLDAGLSDSFRLFDQEAASFSWWDYRAAGFRRNLGLRIDHILVSSDLKEICQSSYIDKAPRKLERPSDHAPVVACFND